MNTTALIMMVVTLLVITVITGYFFYKVLTAPSKPEEDSYSDNDEVNTSK